MHRRWTWILPFGIALLALGAFLGLTARAAPGEAPSVQTSVGTSFTYQGKLENGDDPIDATCSFGFRLYDAASAGNVVGSPLTHTVPVSGGLFAVDLDFGAGVFDGDARWLGVQVQCPGDAGYADLGRQALSATPYAHYALGAPWSGLTGVPADLADGDDDTTYAAGTGLQLIGTTLEVTPTYRLPQTCSSGEIAEWDGTAWTCSDDDDTTTFWSLTGNAGTTPGTDYLGTTDNVTLTLGANGVPILRLVPDATSPNLIGGHSTNGVAAGVVGATIGGGGTNGDPNTVGGNLSTIGGGVGNSVLGFQSTVGGGSHNTIASNWATVGGGWGNTASGDVATIGGGDSNTAGASYTTIAGGRENVITGTAGSAAIGGGRGNVITGTAANFATIPGGAYASATHYGEMAYASGCFDEAGDAQTSLYVLRRTTTGGTVTTLFLDGSSERITLAVSRTLTFDVLITAAADNGDAASYHYVGGIKHTESGGVELIGTPVELMALEDDTSWGITINTTTDGLRIRVTGVAGRTIHWVATVRTAETVMP